MLPEPFLLKNRAPITIYNVYERIQFEERLHVIARQHLNIPHDRRRPHADLERNADHLLQVPDKDHQRACQITQRQHKRKPDKGFLR